MSFHGMSFLPHAELRRKSKKFRDFLIVNIESQVHGKTQLRDTSKCTKPILYVQGLQVSSLERIREFGRLEAIMSAAGVSPLRDPAPIISAVDLIGRASIIYALARVFQRVLHWPRSPV